MTDRYAASRLHGARVTRIKDASVEDVRVAVDMVDLVSGKTVLRRSGGRFVGRCPFHEERTASFSVDPVKKVYHCFGCQKGGDHIGFVQETEGLDFVASVEWLADRYGVKLEYEDSTPEARKSREQRDRLLRLLEDSAAFYSRFLWETKRGGGRARLPGTSGGSPRRPPRHFGLAMRPARGTGCASRRSERDSPPPSSIVPASRCGAAAARSTGCAPGDVPAGRSAGARARVRRASDARWGAPKYKNSPDGPAFRKSDIVYGLDKARAAIARAGEAIVVEGYTDVLALHQVGIENVVASMGTALTAQQVNELKRVCSTLLLAFDADAAGQEASIRGIELALAQEIVVRVVSLPAGRDPADVALADADGFRRATGEAVGYLTFRVNRLLAQKASRDKMYGEVKKVLQRRAGKRRARRRGAGRDRSAGPGARPRPRAHGDQRSGATATTNQRIRRLPWENDARLFLGMCLALPDQAGAAL